MLKSWAIPKGPSMNPADKRLAIMVPDHVLEYITLKASFPRAIMVLDRWSFGMQENSCCLRPMVLARR